MIKAFDYESLIDDFVEKKVKNQYLRIDKKKFTSFKDIVIFNHKFNIFIDKFFMCYRRASFLYFV